MGQACQVRKRAGASGGRNLRLEVDAWQGVPALSCSSEKEIDIVALSFVFDKYYSIMD